MRVKEAGEIFEIFIYIIDRKSRSDKSDRKEVVLLSGF